MFLQKYQLPTGRHSFHDITATVRRAISESGVQEGVAVIFTPHTTAGITITTWSTGWTTPSPTCPSTATPRRTPTHT